MSPVYEFKKHAGLVLDQLSLQVLQWRPALQQRLNARVHLAVEGAFKCKLFRGPVESRNPEMKGQRVIEIDYSCRIPDHLSPQAPEVIQAVEEVMAVKHRGNASANGWKQPAQQAFFMGYTQVEGVAERVEIDLCLQRVGETCELSDYWDLLFRKAELDVMRKERDLAEDRGPETYARVKNDQNEGAKFRLLLAIASGRISPVPPQIEGYVDKWWEWATLLPPTNQAPNWVQQGWRAAQDLKKGAQPSEGPGDSRPAEASPA